MENSKSHEFRRELVYPTCVYILSKCHHYYSRLVKHQQEERTKKENCCYCLCIGFIHNFPAVASGIEVIITSYNNFM